MELREINRDVNEVIRSRTMKRIFKALYYLGVTVGAYLLLFNMVARAATYNFYFNNTEQGDNSSATPSMSVDQNGVKKEGEGEVKTLENTVPPAAEEKEQESTPKGSETLAKIEPEESRTMFRLGLGVSTPLHEPNPPAPRSHFPDFGKDDDFGTLGNKRHAKAGSPAYHGSLNFGFYPLKYLGFNVMASTYSGARNDFWSDGTLAAELEVIPIRANLFGMEDALELGGMLGYWNLVTVTQSSTWPYRNEADSAGTAYVGARAALNFGRDSLDQPRWFTALSVRANSAYTVADLGLGVHF